MPPFVPHTLPLENLDLGSLVTLIGAANRALARYDGLLEGLINPHVLLSPLMTREAERSSRIEGTRADVGDVYQYEAGVEMDEHLAHDSKEIVNYRRALLAANEELSERPIRLGLIRGMHQLLLDSVRGQDKRPGEFRVEQNWIGPKGCTIEEATYIPPAPERLLDHLENWEAFLTYQEDIDPIVNGS